MSTNKRRKLEEGQETPKSAISALSARRRLGAATTPRETSPSPEEEPKQRTGNAFSVLQSLRQGDRAPKSPSTPKPASARKDSASKRSAEKGATTPESGTSTPKVVPYSSFKLTKQNHRRKPNGVTELRLGNSERFIVLGSFGLRIRSGEVAILGATLSASETIHWIHAPHCHALPVIRTSEKTHIELHNDEADQPIMCLSVLSPLYERIWNENDVDEGDDTAPKETYKDTFQILCTSEDAPKKSIIQELNSPPEWNKTISDMTTPTEPSQRTQRTQLSAFICGPKSAGKSTFSKLLMNRLLTGAERPSSTGSSATGVAVIDLDPGQPEYAPAGTVSLVHVTKPNLGTPFTHPGLQQAGNNVLRCHALASTSPATSPSLYIQCAVDLFETYRRTLRNCPLIINTPGWILGTGLDLLVELITKIMPSQVIYMSEDGPFDVVDVLKATTRRQFLTLPSQPSEYTTRTAAHLRAMQAMSYFHLAEADSSAPPSQLSWNPKPLSAVAPWQVRYGGTKPGIRGILSYDFQSPPELFAAAINGMVVAVVEIEDDAAFADIRAGYDASAAQNTSTEQDTSASPELRTVYSPEGLPMLANTNDATLNPCHSRTLGLALVRGVDSATQSLQLLTPTPPSLLRAAHAQSHDIVLVHGRFDAPTWAYAEDYFAQRQKHTTTSSSNINNSSSSQGSSSQRQAERERQKGSELEVTDQDTSEDDSDVAPDDDEVERVRDVQAVPWLEVLQGHQKRPVGSRVWRVRRDLGRGGD